MFSQQRPFVEVVPERGPLIGVTHQRLWIKVPARSFFLLGDQVKTHLRRRGIAIHLEHRTSQLTPLADPRQQQSTGHPTNTTRHHLDSSLSSGSHCAGRWPFPETSGIKVRAEHPVTTRAITTIRATRDKAAAVKGAIRQNDIIKPANSEMRKVNADILREQLPSLALAVKMLSPAHITSCCFYNHPTPLSSSPVPSPLEGLCTINRFCTNSFLLAQERMTYV